MAQYPLHFISNKERLSLKKEVTLSLSLSKSVLSFLPHRYRPPSYSCYRKNLFRIRDPIRRRTLKDNWISSGYLCVRQDPAVPVISLSRGKDNSIPERMDECVCVCVRHRDRRGAGECIKAYVIHLSNKNVSKSLVSTIISSGGFEP